MKGRFKGHCTGCAKKLPESRLGWGLVWPDGSGFCAKCLYDNRKAVNFFEDRKKKRNVKKTNIH
jgi:hypothetical protein